MPRTARLQRQWVPFATNQTVNAGVTTAFDVLGDYETIYGSEPINYTVLAIRASMLYRSTVVTNVFTRFAVGMRLIEKLLIADTTVGPMAEGEADWFLFHGGYHSGPGGDATAMVNVIMPFWLPLHSDSQRKSRGNQHIQLSLENESGGSSLKVAIAGRVLLGLH